MEAKKSYKEVFMVTEFTGKDEKPASQWDRVGAAFVNKDGSLNVVLKAFPVTGKLHIRDSKPSEQK